MILALLGVMAILVFEMVATAALFFLMLWAGLKWGIR